MSWTTGLAIYFVVWWIVLFAVLPFGVQRQVESKPGMEPGAPERPLLWRKAAITTVVAGVVWLLLYVVIAFDLFEVRTALQ